jgi:hypothetical protein
MRVSVLVLVALAVTACGGPAATTAGSRRDCVAKRVPGSGDRVRSSTEEGVTTLTWSNTDGGETIASVFGSGSDAEQAEKAEARLGDAHDRRVKNVLYSGGGAVEDAIVECLS